jgi:hypothetical protein
VRSPKPDLDVLSMVVIKQSCIFAFFWVLLDKIFNTFGYDIPLWFCVILYASIIVEYISLMRMHELLHILETIDQATDENA